MQDKSGNYPHSFFFPIDISGDDVHVAPFTCFNAHVHIVAQVLLLVVCFERETLKASKRIWVGMSINTLIKTYVLIPGYIELLRDMFPCFDSFYNELVDAIVLWKARNHNSLIISKQQMEIVCTRKNMHTNISLQTIFLTDNRVWNKRPVFIF